MNNQITIDGHTFSVSNLNKLLFHKAHVSKKEVLGYYATIAPLMLPHIKDRPLTLQRFPEGIEYEGFFQKDAPEYFPSWIERFHVEKKEGGKTAYVICNNTATLVYLANQGTIAFHRWLSRTDKATKPDLLIFDLDPSTQNFTLVRKTALELKTMLEAVKLIPFVMTTGSRGLHVVVPLIRKYLFDKVQAYAQVFAEELIKKYPDKITTEIRKESRGDKLFIDTHRIAFTATAVAPYSLRVHENASIATPLHWDEVHSSTLRSDKYTIKNILKRIENIEDPWKYFFESARPL